MSETIYDTVPYPSTVFQQTHPERMYAMAWLHGLTPPAVETARVLEIGGGDGMNVIAMATAYPSATFLSFDLSETAVARGQALLRDADLDNVRVETMDILDAAESLDGPFDYVICHGVYAWVPKVVQAAIMKLIGRVLSPQGVAYVSYNALPGGYLRIAIREMLLRHTAGIDNPAEKIKAAQAFLDAYGAPRDNDRGVQATMREMARGIRSKRGAVLYHDELGDIYDPQSITDISDAAVAHGLQYLSDAGPGRVMDGFFTDDAADGDYEALISAAQARDDDGIRFFRQSLLIRGEARPPRRFDWTRLKDLYVGVKATQLSDNTFRANDTEFEVTESDMAQIIAALVRAWPLRVRISEISDRQEIVSALLHQYDHGLTDIFGVELPSATKVPERPRTSPLVAAQLRDGEIHVCTLDQTFRKIDEPGPRAFLDMLDGRHTVPELEALWARSEYAGQVDFEAALSLAMKACLILKG